MARRTNLYQAPRSPLIQGRTRWERPLWQSWLGGAAVAVAVVSGAALVTVSRAAAAGLVPTGFGTFAYAWVAASAIAGSGIGVIAARLVGWRMRWLGAALLGLAAGGVAVWTVVYLPLFSSISLVR